MRRVAWLLLGALAACARPEAARAPRPVVAPSNEVVEIVRLEGGRTGGPRLLELARSGAPALRARAILALGRQGDEANVDAIAAWLGETDVGVRSAAAEALGLIGVPAAAPALIAALAAAPSEALAAALGRVGEGEAAARPLVALLGAPEAKLRAAGARALGALGQRKQPVPDAALAALAGAANDPDADVRYAVAYALFRAPGDAPLPEAAKAALEALAQDAQAETRAIAIRALAAHKAESLVYFASLQVDDWRVRVQAVRALAGDSSDTRAALAGWTAKQLREDAKLWNEPRAHAVLEALTLLAPFAPEPGVAPLFKGAPAALAAAPETLARFTADALVQAARVRLGLTSPADVLDYLAERRGTFPRHERARLALALVAEKKWQTTSAALDFLEVLDARSDPRIVAAVAETAVAFLPEERAAKLVIGALRDGAPMVVGSVADALGAKDAPPASDDILHHAAERLATATDPEIAVGLVGALCRAPEHASSYASALRVAHASPSAVVRKAARECLTKITGTDPGPGVASGPEPATPADPTRLLGHRVAWTVTTTQGDFVVELLPDLAPWNVATLTALAEKGFYDGTLWHRVVPDFVVQGGDPTGSGWGGPGYTVPAETSQRRYLRGTVGIADAGKDTGGSQWFVMHSAAPHLEQRYTIVGNVTSGMEVVDRLHVGDRILRIRVSIDAT